ncbi:hypothetical protein GEV33_007456 [Tenebrio molitor]|uniref:EGF-like domain-containing protein n=1 Tax=Tenebrio molitor TaxID=7067 RepID=A0A8J6HAS1_TENMO|nr:hypothetical protein GEV33_007456 [Tenebrio molitor]
MKYPILIASLFVLHGVHSSGSLSTQKPNVTLISSTASTTPGSSTQGVTESKANPVGNSPVTSPAPTTTTSPNLNVLNATTEITETRPQYPSLHGALTSLEEKLEALACDLPLLPTEYRIWKGNETHELLLPITVRAETARKGCGDVEGPKRVRLEEESRKSKPRRRGADLQIPDGRFAENQTPECGVRFHARISSFTVGPRNVQVSRDVDRPVTIKARVIEKILGFFCLGLSYRSAGDLACKRPVRPITVFCEARGNGPTDRGRRRRIASRTISGFAFGSPFLFLIFVAANKLSHSFSMLFNSIEEMKLEDKSHVYVTKNAITYNIRRTIINSHDKTYGWFHYICTLRFSSIKSSNQLFGIMSPFILTIKPEEDHDVTGNLYKEKQLRLHRRYAKLNQVPTECSQTSLGSKKLGQGNSTEPSVLNATETSTPNCPHPRTLSWDGSIEIQSGDVLLVRIDDSHLIHHNAIMNQSNDTDHISDRLMHEPTTAVYQVTRTGHDHCDVTEGILLDITPLKVDNQKVVTLYDKDLTLGINLLIVVSELWGNQCVRLKVTVKSDNCGENEDCSGKGICYSNVSMDGYECQCCLGFVGQHCEEQDACYPSPCKNNGICVDISQGHEGSTFQCLCPYEILLKLVFKREENVRSVRESEKQSMVEEADLVDFVWKYRDLPISSDSGTQTREN